VSRPRSIDREHLLACAQEIAGTYGIAKLTFGEVGIAAGVSKATVQSVFRTREQLLESMLGRWMEQEQLRFKALAGEHPSATEAVVAHIESTAREEPEMMRRMAAIMAALKDAPSGLAQVVDWYQSRGLNVEASTDQDKALRTAFLAAEGAFFVRYLVGLPMSDEAWTDLFDELKDFGLHHSAHRGDSPVVTRK